MCVYIILKYTSFLLLLKYIFTISIICTIFVNIFKIKRLEYYNITPIIINVNL